jgi:hypothetical protein
VIGHFVHIRFGVIETVVLLDSHLRHLDILVGLEACMFQYFFGAGHRAPVDPHDHFGGFGGFDHPAHMPPDAGQAIHFPHFILGQFQSRQVGDLSHVGTSGAGKNQNLIGLTETLFFHGLFLSLLHHFFDLFHGGKLSGHFHGSIHHQGRGHHHPVAADGFDIFDLNDFSFNAEFFDRLFGSILELVALGSTHSQHFDLFHFLLLSNDRVYEIYPCPQRRFMNRPYK